MNSAATLDMLVKQRLRRWPQCPPGLRMRTRKEAWLRGRPSEEGDSVNPFLKLPGSTRRRTLPDGLWLNFGGTASLVTVRCASGQIVVKKWRAGSTSSLVTGCMSAASQASPL